MSSKSMIQVEFKLRLVDLISVEGTDVSFVSHLSGSSLWGRQSLVEMLCLQAAGLRPQQSHRISVEVMGC